MFDVTRKYHQYSLTDKGYARGVAVLGTLRSSVLATWKTLPSGYDWFPSKHLLSAIYRQYPDMAVNSLILQDKRSYPQAWFRFDNAVTP